MTTQRLTFLYPHLFRTARQGKRVAISRCRRRQAPSTHQNQHCRHGAAPFVTSNAPHKGTFAPRVGKAVEPKPLGDVQNAPALESHMKGNPKEAPTEKGPEDGEVRHSTPEERERAAKELDPQSGNVNEILSSPGVSFSGRTKKSGDGSNTKASPSNKGNDSADPKTVRATGPMDAVLHMPPPEETWTAKPEVKPPHLTPPPYVHHFDSYSLVKQLEGGGYTQAQAITAMKAVRALLAQNLDVAQGGLVSKSDVENETYLFKAACAELSTEVMNSRRVAEESLRQQRTILQHEVDNTSQALNQELLTLNDNVKGMFNDRKMTVREEQKAAESAVQQIAYKISVTLNSDSKSQIEAVRWVLARRAVIGLFFMVTVSLIVLRYSSVVSQEQKKEEKKEKEEAEALKKSDGSRDVAQAPDAAEILAAN
ncbi:Uncharacterized protein C27B12.07 [Cytospora mali]|uniref:Uncharacterized protein C27B12.07 n=1 Tax=Cytospora mali TaxID=578113 RepID=A0A194VM64_CYTMA|nr:Uncharacterized protein C27B12.07 [Valsa mali]